MIKNKLKKCAGALVAGSMLVSTAAFAGPAQRANHAAHRANHAARRANHAANRANHAANRANHAARRANHAANRHYGPRHPYWHGWHWHPWWRHHSGTTIVIRG